MNKHFLLKLLFICMLLQSTITQGAPTNLEFPYDHGKHTQFGQEWWVFYGHLMDEKHHVFGFRLSFFRLGVPWQASPSQWNTKDIYASWFTITDNDSQQFYSQEKVNRTSFNFAGSSEAQMQIWNMGWQANMQGDQMTLFAKTKQMQLALHLKSTAQPLLFWQNGFSKSQGMYEYVLPSLTGFGELQINSKSLTVAVISGGVEHGFTDPKNRLASWDKMSIHLNNNERIFIYTLSDREWIDAESFCIINRADGESVRLDIADCQLRPQNQWTSPESNATYPSSWELIIPKYDYRLMIKPTLKNQEITTLNTTFWGGQGLVEGKRDNETLTGFAYIELSKKNLQK